MKQLVARAGSAGRKRGAAMLALLFLGGFAANSAHAEQGERPFWRANKEQREQRQQLREERQQRQEQVREQRQDQMREQRQLRQEELRERAHAADENHDRALNRDEAQKHFPRLGKRFDQIDGNRDGVITRDEVRAFRDARARARVWAGEGDDPRD